MERDKEFNVVIVKGEVASYAKMCAQNENVSKKKLAEILREIADLIELTITNKDETRSL